MRISILISICLLSFSVNAQKTEKKDVKKAPLQGFNISGNYRFYTQHRVFTNPYAIDIANDEPVYLDGRSILVGDATQLPELTLNISGKPTSNTSFGTDIVVWNQNTGGFDYYRNLQLGINLYGSFSIDFANVGIKAGGIHWHSMTPFTMMSFAGYNRYSIFERNPWDPQYKKMEQRYEDYVDKGAISQDARWANQPMQGLILDFTELPLGLSANIIYGKTQNAGSALATLDNDLNDSTNNSNVKYFENTIPNNIYGGRLIKTFKKHTVSLNTFNRKTFSDVLALDPIENHIYTSDFRFDFNKVSLSGELGAGKYSDVYNKDTLGYGEMASIKINFNKKVTGIPLEIHAYHISPNVVNNNAEFINTSVSEATSAASGAVQAVGANGVLQQSGSGMLGIGQMANNRQGINLNTDIKIKDLTLILGTGVSKEIESRNKQVSFGHTINGLTMSRFWRWSFPANVGPYNKKSVLYRGVYETINLTDLDNNGEVVNDKYFNNLEAQLKYKFNFLNRPWYAFYLGSYNSVQSTFSPVTVFSEDAYLRVYTHQLENYYKISSTIVLAQYLGWERIIGNYDTQVDIDSGRPINQEGISIGFGLDYMLAKNVGLYLRHRYFRFADVNIVKTLNEVAAESFDLHKNGVYDRIEVKEKRSWDYDQFSGHETTLELKINF